MNFFKNINLTLRMQKDDLNMHIKKEKILVFLLLFFSLNFSKAGWFDGKIQMHICQNGNQADTLSCNSKCKKLIPVEAEFKINPNTNVILKKTYIYGKLSDTEALDSCKIIDKKNWICELTDNTAIHQRWVSRHIMNNGIYANIITVNNVARDFTDCAK